jgi:hypothetical protein
LGRHAILAQLDLARRNATDVHQVVDEADHLCDLSIDHCPVCSIAFRSVGRHDAVAVNGTSNIVESILLLRCDFAFRGNSRKR